MDPRLRPNARALLVDADDCVLLSEWLHPAGPLWITPGGGIEEGESELDGLRRELLEEVGHALDGTPPLVWRRTVVLPDLIPDYDGQREAFWLVRVERFDPRGALSDADLADEGIGRLRWWTLDEVDAATDEVFAPRRLAALLRTLLAEGPPEEILELGL